ncbi:MAG: DUF72 domain-containing protein [Planctomycetia bacterium]|nr:DUF72 domain-containing protein [Planctomycetia bacterium]
MTESLVTARQRTLFGDDPEDETASRDHGPAAGPPVAPHPVDDTVRALAGTLHPRIRLGTSSWSFPGWTGLVYAPRAGKPESEQRLARGGLPAYAAHPLLRAVSIDRTFHAPITAAEFARYAAAVPDGFRFVVKAPAACTDPVIRQPGSGMAARDNPSFLDAAAAVAAFVQPAVAGLGKTAGPLVFQFPPLGHAGRGYEQARGDYFPFNRLVEEDEPSRLALARHAAHTAGAGSDVFITINNKAEGSAPLSVAKLAAAIAAVS